MIVNIAFVKVGHRQAIIQKARLPQATGLSPFCLHNEPVAHPTGFLPFGIVIKRKVDLAKFVQLLASFISIFLVDTAPQRLENLFLPRPARSNVRHRTSYKWFLYSC
jgi:hypothetical protein